MTRELDETQFGMNQFWFFVIPGIHVVFPLDDFLLFSSSWSSDVSLWRSEILERDKELWKCGEAFNRSQ